MKGLKFDMKFVHIADVHFDIPFKNLQSRGLAEQRRLEARSAFKRVIDYIQENNIEYLFICGDLYEEQYVKQSTIEFINKLFEQIPNTKIELPKVNIYGFGFDDFYIKESKYKELRIEDREKINILLTHGDLDGIKNNDAKYNSIPKTELKGLGFDYVAMGHIHKPMYDNNIVYSGSLISLGFDELGEHGMIVRRNK